MIHEREHARRRDPLVQWLALLNRCVFWFHPLAWWLERKLAALAEEACDAAVLAGGHAPHDYARYLIEMARSVNANRSADSMGRRRGIFGRQLAATHPPDYGRSTCGGNVARENDRVGEPVRAGARYLPRMQPGPAARAAPPANMDRTGATYRVCFNGNRGGDVQRRGAVESRS